jgi:hypothetical protein
MEKGKAVGRESRSATETYNMMYVPYVLRLGLGRCRRSRIVKIQDLTPGTPTSDWKGEFAFERHFKYLGKQKHQ